MGFLFKGYFMKIYKFELREFCGNQHSYDTRATHTGYYMENSIKSRSDFCKSSKKFDVRFVNSGICKEYSDGFKITEIEVL